MFSDTEIEAIVYRLLSNELSTKMMDGYREFKRETCGGKFGK